MLVKTTQKDWLMPNEKITLTTTITNNADESISDFHFQDTLSQDATFVAGSIKINDTERTDLDLANGFALTYLQPNGTITITYSAKVK